MLDERDLHVRHGEAVTKYVYYLVATALAAMAFTVHTTQGQALSWAHLGFGFAALSWGFSAYLGLRLVGDSTLIDRLNLESHLIRRGASPGVHPDDADEADKLILERISGLNRRNRVRNIWQWRLLMAGALFFISSHIARMAVQAAC